MVEVLSGRAVINGIAARYSVYASDSGVGPLADAVVGGGWRETPAEAGLDFETSAAKYEVRVFRRGGETLLLAFPCEGEGLVLAGVFEGELKEAPAGGEAPGRDPASVPRPVKCRRILHVGGGDWEAAWYLTAAPAEAVLREGERRLSAAGWRVEKDGGVFTAWREGRPQVTVMSSPGDKETRFFILATGGKM